MINNKYVLTLRSGKTIFIFPSMPNNSTEILREFTIYHQNKLHFKSNTTEYERLIYLKNFFKFIIENHKIFDNKKSFLNQIQEKLIEINSVRHVKFTYAEKAKTKWVTEYIQKLN